MDSNKKAILSRWKLLSFHFEQIAELVRKMRIDLEEYWDEEYGGE